MHDEELLQLYAADQDERQKLLRITDRNELEKMKESILSNDASRRELAAELMSEPAGSIQRDYRNYFYAAVIFSRGLTPRDHEKAFSYAKKAYQIAQFQDDPLSVQIKEIYAHTADRIKKGNSNRAPTQQETNRIFALRPEGPKNRQIESDKKRAKEEEQIKKIPRCFVCGKQHGGPCPPK